MFCNNARYLWNNIKWVCWYLRHMNFKSKMISSLLNVYCDPFFYIKHQCSAPWFWHIIPDSDLNVRSLFILWGIWNLIPCKFENLCYKRCLHNTPYVNLIVDFPSREYTNESVVLPQYFNINQNSFQDQSSFLQIHFTHIKY